MLSYGSLNRLKRPVKLVASAEILGTSDDAYEAYLIKDAYCRLLGVNFPLSIIVNTKDLYETISTKCPPTDKSIKRDVASLRSDFVLVKLIK